MSPFKEREKTITPNTRVPLYVLGSAIGLAIYIGILFANLSAKLDAAVTEGQFQHWIDDAREQNPMQHWPRLPGKQTHDNGMKLTQNQ